MENKNYKINPVFKYFLRLLSILRTNIRDYGMYIALAAIFIVFTIITGGMFLGKINFTNLLNQTAYVAVLAVGMTLVIVTRQIDLSVGYLGAFLGAYVLVAVEHQNTPVILALFLGLGLAIIIGYIKGFLVANVKIPSFVVTLGGMFIFKGLLMIKTDNRTIPTTNNFFNKIGVGYLSTSKIGGFNTLTLIVGILIVGFILYSGFAKRVKNKKIGIKNEYLSIFITKTIFINLLLGFIIYNLASYRGISYLLFITIIVTVLYHLLTTKTVLGRRIYAVGGNPEAAELSGISVKFTLVIVFISMTILSLVSGVMYVSQVQNAHPQHGLSWEMYAIAAAYIGGTSASGGVGKVINAVVGSVVIVSLQNGMRLAGVSTDLVQLILGIVLILAVVFDIYTRNVRTIDLVGVHYAKKKYKDEFASAKLEYNKVREKIAQVKKGGVSDQELISLEFELTRLQSEYTKYKDLIRNAKEEDFIRS